MVSASRPMFAPPSIACSVSPREAAKMPKVSANTSWGSMAAYWSISAQSGSRAANTSGLPRPISTARVMVAFRLSNLRSSKVMMGCSGARRIAVSSTESTVASGSKAAAIAPAMTPGMSMSRSRWNMLAISSPSA